MFVEFGLIRMRQEVMGFENEIAINPKNLKNLINALDLSYFDWVKENENESNRRA